ncbi:MAG: V-type ATP synthase subunit F [Oscillospiraceae bacterium]|jgi:V/A-type H+-transporting ATPase subunit F|nr:V-type ATP synthase subunit F [Oscillospiraceae bacterium]
MHKIAVIGEMDNVYGFRGLGFEVFIYDESSEPEDVIKCINRLFCEKYAIIYITESVAKGVAGEILSYQDQKMPAIVLIPGDSGDKFCAGNGDLNLRKLVEKAVGSDIL